MTDAVRMDNPTLVRYVRDILEANLTPAVSLELSRQVVLTIPIAEAVLRPMEIISGSEVAVSADGFYTSLVIPNDETWEVFGLRTYHSTGTFDVTIIKAIDADGNTYPLKDVAGTPEVTSLLYEPQSALPFPGGFSFGATVVNYFASGDIGIRALVRRYKA